MFCFVVLFNELHYFSLLQGSKMHVLFVIFPFATFQAVCNGFTYGKPEVNHLAANHFRDVHRRLKRSLGMYAEFNLS